MSLVRRSAWLLTLAIALSRTIARAEPALEVTVSGECPSQAELVEALTARHLAVARWSVDLRSVPGGAAIRLRNPARDVVLERELQSGDCAAMAAAFALIVEGYFIEIGIIAEPASGAPGQAEAAPAAATEPASAPPPRSAGSPEPGRIEPRPPLARARRTRLRASLAAGPELVMPSPVVTLAGGVAFGLEWSRPPVYSEMGLYTTLPTVIRVGEDRVWRWASRAQLVAGATLGSSPAIEPWAAAGLTGVRLEARALPVHPLRTFWSPVVGGGVAVRQQLGGAWAGRVDFGCHFPLLSERYSVGRVDIGRGPRFACDLTYGFLWTERSESSRSNRDDR
jgi:hypothetical protein